MEKEIRATMAIKERKFARQNIAKLTGIYLKDPPSRMDKLF